MIIDMNGPDIQAVHVVKARILEYINAWKNFKKRMPSRSSAGPKRPSRSAQGTSNVYYQLSGIEDVGFNYFIEDDFIPEGDGQVASGSASLPDSVARNRHSRESRMSVMFLKHWVSTSVKPECLSRMCCGC